MKKIIKLINTEASTITVSLIDSPASFRLFLVYSIIMLAYQFSVYFSWPLHDFFARYLDGPANGVFCFTPIFSVSILRFPCSRNVNPLLLMLLLMLLYGVYDCHRHQWGFGDPVSSPSDYHPSKGIFNIVFPLIWLFTVIPDLKKWTKTIEPIVAPNRSLAPTLKSTSPVRGSED